MTWLGFASEESAFDPGAAVAQKTRAIGRELLRTVMALLMDYAILIGPNR
jgi:hypothetical protein